MLTARIQAGNSSSTQGEMPMPTSSTTAVASPATVTHRDTILVRRRNRHGGQREHRRHPHRVDVQQDPGDVAAQRQGARPRRAGCGYAGDEAGVRRRPQPPRTACRRTAHRCPGRRSRRSGPTCATIRSLITPMNHRKAIPANGIRFSRDPPPRFFSPNRSATRGRQKNQPGTESLSSTSTVIQGAEGTMPRRRAAARGVLRAPLRGQPARARRYVSHGYRQCSSPYRDSECADVTLGAVR